MTTITIRGNLTAPPELRYTQSGKPVASVTVAENTGRDEQKRTHFHRVTLWGELGEHAATLEKGTSVIVVGRLEQREYQDREGNNRTSWDVIADAFGPDLRFQTAVVTRAGGGQASTKAPGTPGADAWSTPTDSGAQTDAWDTRGAGDETPF